MSITQTNLPPPVDGAQPAAPRWSPLGKHRCYVEEDLVVLELSGGEFSLEDSQMLIDVVESVQSRFGYYLLLGDITRGISLTSAVRRKVADWATASGPNPVTALVGARLPARAALTLAIQAMRLLGSDNYKTEFFSEAEAGRKWLHAQREQAMLRRKAR